MATLLWTTAQPNHSTATTWSVLQHPLVWTARGCWQKELRIVLFSYCNNQCVWPFLSSWAQCYVWKRRSQRNIMDINTFCLPSHGNFSLPLYSLCGSSITFCCILHTLDSVHSLKAFMWFLLHFRNFANKSLYWICFKKAFVCFQILYLAKWKGSSSVFSPRLVGFQWWFAAVSLKGMKETGYRVNLLPCLCDLYLWTALSLSAGEREVLSSKSPPWGGQQLTLVSDKEIFLLRAPGCLAFDTHLRRRIVT